MSSEYHRPTHTFEADAYNATQVRLYGLQASGALTASEKIEAGDLVVHISAESTAEDAEENKPVFNLVKLQTQMMGLIMLATVGNTKKTLSTGIIFGYAYEGHCYDLPKPKIMLIPAMPSEIFPKDDCGFDAKKDENYRVWVVDKLDKCAEIELNQGFVEQIVLEANLPGKRSPRSYSATMQLAHRSGRLTE